MHDSINADAPTKSNIYFFILFLWRAGNKAYLWGGCDYLNEDLLQPFDGSKGLSGFQLTLGVVGLHLHDADAASVPGLLKTAALDA